MLPGQTATAAPALHPLHPPTTTTTTAATTAREARPRPSRPTCQVTGQGVRGVAAQRTATKRSAAEAGADEEE